MKTFQEFILECELIEGKVEWDNPKNPNPSGYTPREKNRMKRMKLGIEDPNTDSFFGGPTERDYERYGKLKLAHEEQKGKKPPKKSHQFKKLISRYPKHVVKGTIGQIRRKANPYWASRLGTKDVNINTLKEPKK